jgi:hypothetical protein
MTSVKLLLLPSRSICHLDRKVVVAVMVATGVVLSVVALLRFRQEGFS